VYLAANESAAQFKIAERGSSSGGFSILYIVGGNSYDHEIAAP
jgi:hypothetical protein